MQFSVSFLCKAVSDAFAGRVGPRGWSCWVMSLPNQGRATNQGRIPMKLATLALASAFALSSTFAFAYTSHHKRTHSASQYRSSYGQYYGSPNNRGGLVGGSDV